MRPATFLCILLLCVSGTAVAQEWTEYVDTQNGFKLNFPGQPKVTETTWTSQMNYTLPARVQRGEGPRTLLLDSRRLQRTRTTGYRTFQDVSTGQRAMPSERRSGHWSRILETG